MLRTAQMGNTIQHQTPALASTAYSGISTMPAPGQPMQGINDATANAAHPEQDVFTGTGPQRQAQQQQQAMGRLMTSPHTPEMQQQFLRMRAAMPAGENPPGNLFVDPAIKTEAAAQAQRDKQENLRLMAALRPPPADKLTKVEHQDPTTGRTVIEWLPQSEIRGQTFKKGTSATAETRLASAQAVNQTGNDIIAKLRDPAFKATVGPLMGRAGTLRDLVGNPPPEFSDLAGTIESYALANMGVHGMRSSQGAEQIKHLLDQHHTPESLIAAIQGLNRFSEHFMQNEGRGSDGGGGTGGDGPKVGDTKTYPNGAKATFDGSGWVKQ
jgi:hypothetical protein